MTQVGRNDRCPCGSGRKYKRCCLEKEAPNVSHDLPWRQVRAARDSLNAQLMEFSIKVYDKTALHTAWDDWCCGFDEELVMHGGEFVAFMSWFLVDWLDYDEKKKIPLPPLSWRFQTEFEKRLSPVEKEYLESVIEEPYSFFEIVSVKSGEGYLVKDILIGREIYVHERSGSRGAQSGGILYGRLATVGDVTIFDAVSEILFPPEWKNTILELRQDLRKVLKIPKTKMPSIEQIHGFGDSVRRVYRAFRDQALHPQTPKLVNTDGEELSFNKVIFEIDDANAVFNALHSLCFAESKDTLLEWAEKDRRGDISKFEFSWLKKGNKQHKGMENTVLGHVTIEQSRLTVETNSLERVEAIKDIVRKRCGTSARFKTTLIEPFEGKMKEYREKQPKAVPSMSQEELMNLPEVKAKLQEMQRKHMEAWVKQKIPALGNKTPTQAIKTPEGREMVESLLAQFERSAGNLGDKEFELSVIRGVREKLGLPSR